MNASNSSDRLGSKLGHYALGALAHLLLLLAWYLFVKLGNVPRFVMPSPADTWRALMVPDYGWWTNTAVTATEIFGGYGLALLVGVLLALLFTWSKTLESLMLPLLVTLNMIPKVALGPLIIVWFKYGVFPNSLMAFSIAVFPILLATYQGTSREAPGPASLIPASGGMTIGAMPALRRLAFSRDNSPARSSFQAASAASRR